MRLARIKNRPDQFFGFDRRRRSAGNRALCTRRSPRHTQCVDPFAAPTGCEGLAADDAPGQKRGPWWQYDNPPLASDILWTPGFQAGDGVVTNHQWGGEKTTYLHFFIAPMYWWTRNGTGEANYVFEDGSVRQWADCTYSNLGSETYAIPTNGVGNDVQRVPKEWGEAL